MARLLDERIDHLIAVTLPKRLPIISKFVHSDLSREVRAALVANAGELISPIISRVGTKLSRNIRIQRIVEEKVAGYSSEKLEELLLAIMKREFRFIEYVGAVLGFLIGSMQAVMTLI